MSLVALVLRVATVYALKGATLAGDYVLDAPIDPVDEVGKVNAPVLAVFTGNEVDVPDGRDLIGGDVVLSLFVQSYLPDGVELSLGGVPVRIDSRGSGAEMALNVLERQIVRQLLASNDPWPTLWRDLIVKIEESTSQGFLLRKGIEDNRISIPARELDLTISPLSDPPLGGPVPELWTEAFALMRTVPDLLPLVGWLEAEAGAPAVLPDWRRDQANSGFTLREIGALGLAPADRPVEAPSVLAEHISIGSDPDAIELEADFLDEVPR